MAKPYGQGRRAISSKHFAPGTSSRSTADASNDMVIVVSLTSLLVPADDVRTFSIDLERLTGRLRRAAQRALSVMAKPYGQGRRAISSERFAPATSSRSTVDASSDMVIVVSLTSLLVPADNVRTISTGHERLAGRLRRSAQRALSVMAKPYGQGRRAISSKHFAPATSWRSTADASSDMVIVVSLTSLLVPADNVRTFSTGHERLAGRLRRSAQRGGNNLLSGPVPIA